MKTNYLISMAAALARALAAQAAAVVQTTAFRRRALQVAVQSAAKRFRRGFIPRQLNLPALAGKSLSYMTVDSGFHPVFGLHSRIWPSPGKIFLKNQ